MGEFVKKLGSRKLLMAVGTIVGIIATSANGQHIDVQALLAILGVVLGYLGVQGFVDYKALTVNPAPMPFTGTQTETGASIAGELAPGLPLAITVGEGQKPAVTLDGKDLSKMQFPKDFLPLLGKLKL